MDLNRLMLACLASLSALLCGCGSEDSTETGTNGSQDTTDADEATGPSPAYIAAQDDPALAAQAAQEAVRQMLALARDGAWEAYITGYYGEIDKIENDGQMAVLVSRFEQHFGPIVIPVLERAAEITPTIEDDRALFQVDGETIYELHLGDDGRWGFHL